MSGIMRLLRHRHLVVLYCFALSIFSFFFLSPDGSNSIVVFILIALLPFIIRPLHGPQVKITCYLLLGMLGYWAMGSSFVSSGFLPEPTLPATVALSALGAILALVTYSDGKLSGYAFAGGSLVLLFLATKDIWSISSALLLFISTQIIVYFVYKISGPEDFAKNLMKGQGFSALFLFCAALVPVLEGALLGVYSFPNPVSIGVSFAYVLLANILFVGLTLYAFDTVLARIKLKRYIEEDRVLYGSIGPQSAREHQLLPRKAKK